MPRYNLKQSPLPQPRQDNLKKLFQQPSWDDFLKVIDGLAREHECEAFNAQAEASDYNKYSDKALGELKKAKEYRVALRVIQEVQANPKTYMTAEGIT